MSRERGSLDRRTILKLTGVSSLGVVAGCLSDDDDGSVADDDDDGETSTGDENGDDTENGTGDENGATDPTEEHDPIGNWPPDGDEVVYGFDGALSGPLAVDGTNQRRGFELAIEHLNNGGGIVEYWDPLSGAGVLGYDVRSVELDSGGRRDTSSDNAHSLIDDEHVQFWTDGWADVETFDYPRTTQPEFELPSIAQQANVPYLAGSKPNPAHTTEHCSRYLFHQGINAPLVGMAAGALLPEVLGDDRELFHIYMDNDYGHNHRDAMQTHLTDNGPWVDAGEVSIDPRDHDHAPEQLELLEDSGADVLHFASFGEFAAAGLSQLRDIGLLGFLDDIDVFIPYLPLATIELTAPITIEGWEVSNPEELREHVYGFELWNPGYAAEDDAAAAFVDAYEREYGELPCQNAFYTYDTVLHYSAAVEQTGTFHPPSVIRELEDFSWEHGGGPRHYRGCDHQAERPQFLARGVDDERMEEIGYPTEIVEVTDPLSYDCEEYSADECEIDEYEYGDE